MPLVYIVFEEGVYRHRILGVYDTQPEAEGRAEREAKESDGYHEYKVGSIEKGNHFVLDVDELVSFQRRQAVMNGRNTIYPDVERRVLC